MNFKKPSHASSLPGLVTLPSRGFACFKKRRIATLWQGLVGVAVGMLVSQAASAETSACGSLATNWHQSGGGEFRIAQSTNGTLSGTFFGNGAQNCPEYQNYSLSGTTNLEGQFSVTGIWTKDERPFPVGGGPRPPGCAQTFTYSGTVGGTACGTATTTWSNSGGLHGTDVWSGTCRTPTSETGIALENWGTGNESSVATFRQYAGPASVIVPTSYNWSGRKIQEVSYQQGYDGCWWQGISTLIPSPMTTVTGGPPITLKSNSGVTKPYRDEIGATKAAVEVYRRAGRVPCGYTQYQAVQMQCAAAGGGTTAHTFAQNVLNYSILLSQVRAQRGNVDSGLHTVLTPTSGAVILPIIVHALLSE